jgi:hypothetical protein
MNAAAGRHPAPRDPASGRAGVPDHVLLLAAIDRAGRHGEGRSLKRVGERRARGRIGIPIFFLARHLGYPPRTRIRRQLRNQLDEATEKGWLERSDSPDPTVWALTAKGRSELVRHQGRVSAATRALPESPQHEAWREARRVAGLQIAELRERLREALANSSTVPDKESTESAVWLRLADASQRLGAATYCLYEWPEPDDLKLDVAEPPDVSALRDWQRWSLSHEPGAKRQ